MYCSLGVFTHELFYCQEYTIKTPLEHSIHSHKAWQVFFLNSLLMTSFWWSFSKPKFSHNDSLLFLRLNSDMEHILTVLFIFLSICYERILTVTFVVSGHFGHVYGNGLLVHVGRGIDGRIRMCRWYRQARYFSHCRGCQRCCHRLCRCWFSCGR